MYVNLKEIDIHENIDINQLWSDVIRDLTLRYGEGVYKSWFSKIFLVTNTESSVTIGAPTQFIRDWIKTNYFSTISQLFMHYNPRLISIDIIVAENLNTNPFDLVSINSVKEDLSTNQFNNKTEYQISSNEEEKKDQIMGSNLDPRFTFDSFVVGSPNQLAYAAARAVAESKLAISESNPLFLYGGVGLGKTHLMHAIAWHIKQTNPNRKVIYMSAEKFMYQFVSALRNKSVMNFKSQFRSVDVLMIDDIQFICGKDSTQEEFFHTFNALIDNNRQMVISCDRSPTDLDNIEDRIKSRLGWGLVADVHSTTYELRLGILQSKIEQMQVNVPNNVMEFLAAKITSNVRELEGALNKVVAHSVLVGKKITLESTQDILKDLLRSNERYVTIEDIQRKIAERYNIKISDMSSARRQRSVARPRQIGMFLSKKLTTKSLCDIGKKFGNKDHSTVLHACKQIEKLIIEDPEMKEEVELLSRILQS